MYKTITIFNQEQKKPWIILSMYTETQKWEIKQKEKKPQVQHIVLIIEMFVYINLEKFS